jgi:cytochrome c553
LAAGKAVWEKLNCASCHGATGAKSIDPSYPILAGQHADFLVQALRSYQRGAAGAPASANVRKNAVMGAFAKQLSKQDVDNVSAWLAAQPGPLAVRR